MWSERTSRTTILPVDAQMLADGGQVDTLSRVVPAVET